MFARARILFSCNDRRTLFDWLSVLAILLGIIACILFRHYLTTVRYVPMVVGGICAILASMISIFHIMGHLTFFANVECQTKVVRILFMVPVYALSSWFSIMAPSAAVYLNLIRDAFEAYVLYAFHSLMIVQMGGLDTLYRALMIQQAHPLAHLPPLCFLSPMAVTPLFVQHCQYAVFQFMLIKPLVTFITIGLTAEDLMGDNLFDITKGYFWTSLVYNISACFAFAGLLYFYLGLRHFLPDARAGAYKIICIKLIIFLSYWQGLLFALLGAFNALPKFNYWTADEATSGLQDFCICCEMLFISIAHKFCFTTTEFTATWESIAEEDPFPESRRTMRSNLKYTLRHEDLVEDLNNIVRSW